jgi:putative ABC transport system substrate-binding protein
VTKAAKLLGITVLFVDVESFSELEPLVKRLVRQGIDGATLLEGQSDVQQRRRAAALFIENRLPSMGDAREGFLLDYDVQFRLAAETAAKYVDKILKGAKPADLPVEQVSTYQLVINLKTARALWLNISPSLLQQADEVIQ